MNPGSKSKSIQFVIGLALVAALAMANAGLAANLAPQGVAPSLIADPVARHVGDSLNVQIYETASASNSAQGASKRSTRADGQLNMGKSNGKLKIAGIGYAGGFDSSGQSGRADKIVAQISVIVTDVLPNGDLRVAGDETLIVNGETTRIHVRGRVRPQDITSSNSVMSTRLAEAQIDYSGAGVVSRSAQPGLIVRLLNRVGLF